MRFRVGWFFVEILEDKTRKEKEGKGKERESKKFNFPPRPQSFYCRGKRMNE